MKSTKKSRQELFKRDDFYNPADRSIALDNSSFSRNPDHNNQIQRTKIYI
ncbi:hypothetical protein X474_03635 [Dethiosulfatarculus sandiegensis]|uniref:Uncharacterized protein n=1 Tax=Dethiosulfatarculus sandiegensis TaxID=1429043 RepID=A0A0D2K149_9BACT|nr:hypothetical protein X474_03635 [Dethiosulfatarculus sandiegensis]